MLNVTNIPGPQLPLYSGGAQLLEVWPFAPLYPSMGLGIPVEQYRDNYDFLTPTTYTKSYVGMIAPAGAHLTLDGSLVNGKFTAIGTTGYGYLRQVIDPGAHHLTGDAKFGIFVSGVASYTSYIYAGGLNLNEVPVGKPPVRRP